MRSLPPRVSIESLCSKVTSGGTPSRQNENYWSSGNIPWIKTGELNDAIISDSEEKITAEGLLNSSAKLFPINTVLMAMYGDGKTITSLGILGCEASTNQASCAMIADPEKCEYLYLFYALRFHRHELLKLVVAGAQRNLSAGIIKRFKVNFFNLPTQRKIASALSAYDDLIENNRRRIQLLEESARLLYKEWFVHLRFPGHEHTKIIDGVPEGWERKPLRSIARVASGYAFKSKNWTEHGYPVIKIKNITGNNTVEIIPTQCVSETAIEKAKRFILSEGDFLIAMTGATVGKVGIVPKLAQATYLNQRVGKFEYQNEVDLTAFLLPYFNSEIGHSSIVNLAAGAAQPNISGKQIESIHLLIPTNRLLKEYINNVEATFKQRLTLYEQNQKLAQARDLLLPRLMNGEIEV